MKQCPQCHNKYPDSDFCLVDGTKLLMFDPQADTLRYANSQPPNTVEYIYKKITLKAGEYFSLELKYSDIKIYFRDIEQHKFTTSLGQSTQDAAKLYIDTGGGIIHGGKITISTKVNEYLVPVKYDLEEPYSLYFYYAKEDTIRFFRVFVSHINSYAKEVELDIAYLRYMTN